MTGTIDPQSFPFAAGVPFPVSSVDLRSFEGKIIRECYLLQQHIGEGYYGAVFRAMQFFLDMPVRTVALKLSKYTNLELQDVKAIFADAFMLAQAMQEISDAEARKHLVHIYDLGIMTEEEGRGFIVMEYIRGISLAKQFELFQRVPCPIMVRWTQQICRALAALHSLAPPVLHRDLTPQNILMEFDQTLRIVDFGLAARLLYRGYAPGTAGTLAYMAPETTRGESVPASDVYSIGILLYEGLTGQYPFDTLIPPHQLPLSLHGDWLYAQKKTYRLLPPSYYNNTVSPELDAIVLRCLAFEVHQRFQNAGELLQALSGEQAQADPPEVTALKTGREMKAANRLKEAHQLFERALALPINNTEVRFSLLRELGETLMQMENYAQAISALVKAWELTRHSGLLRTRAERAALLRQVSMAYRRSGNHSQARKYTELAGREMRGDRNTE